MVIIVIIIILIIMAIYFSWQKEKQEEANNEIMNAVRTKFRSLNNLVISSYELKVCPRCFENRMELLSFSPTGQSIEYKCVNCSKKLTGKLFFGKDGSEAAKQFNEVMRKAGSFIGPMVKVDVSFIVDTHLENSFESRQRTSIPESVRHEVWRRDQGRCVTCGSQINLEYDHIIPFSRGGSNTARNIQLLCEACNRRKHARI